MDRLSGPPLNKDDGDTMLDPSSFMILDSVGSGDESEEGEKREESQEDGDANKDEESKEDGEKTSAEDRKKKKKEIKLGSEFCKLVQVYYCDLCKLYLPRLDDKERALTIHCRSRTHLQRYIRNKDDANLRRKAVKLHKERQKLKVKKEKEPQKVTEKEEKDNENVEDETKTKNDSVDNATEGVTEDSKDKLAVKKDDEEGEEKVWSEVDKDLSDLLQDGEEGSEEGKLECFDKFKHASKKTDDEEEELKTNGTQEGEEKTEVSKQD